MSATEKVAVLYRKSVFGQNRVVFATVFNVFLFWFTWETRLSSPDWVINRAKRVLVSLQQAPLNLMAGHRYSHSGPGEHF
jgi:hypothetical protein